MRQHSALLPVVLSSIFWAGTAQATPIVYTTALSGLAESPPNGSPGTGFATITVDSATATMTLDVTFQDLIGAAGAADIHCCTASPLTGIAGVATSFAGPSLGVTTGTDSETLLLANPASWNPVFFHAATATLAAAAAAGDTNIKVSRVGGFVVGTLVTIGPASSSDVRRIVVVGTSGAGGTGLTLDSPLTVAHPSGTSLNFWTTGGATTALLTGLAAGRAYFEIETGAFPGGEVRGFLAEPVPEPSSLFLVGAALGIVGLRRWRRRPARA